MRIIAGKYKGKKLSAGSDLSIRPITNRLKEIIFSIINDFVHDKMILDLFCGSGSLGIEALSRGASHITFIEKEESSIRILNKNINNLKLDAEDIRIVRSDVLDFLKSTQKKYHLIFSDPPFKYVSVQHMVNQVFISDILEMQGLLVVHHEIDNPIQTENEAYELLKQKKVGRSILSFLSKEKNSG